MIIMVIKDILMITGGVIIIRRGIIPPKSLWYGKVSTALFYISVCAVVLMAIVGYQNELLTMCLLGVTAAFMVFSLVNYFFMYLKIMKEADLKETSKHSAAPDQS